MSESLKKTQTTGYGLALPVAVFCFAAYKAMPSLWEGWHVDLYARGGTVAFAIWLGGQAALSIMRKSAPQDQLRVFWIAGALAATILGTIIDMNIVFHLGLGLATAGLFNLGLASFLGLAATPCWLPATGWFLSKFMRGGLTSWERPLAAVLFVFCLIALDRYFAKHTKFRTISNET